MYEVLIAHLRECAKLDPSNNTYAEAADAVEEMNRRIDRAIELYNRNVEKSAMYEALAGISPEPPKEKTC